MTDGMHFSVRVHHCFEVAMRGRLPGGWLFLPVVLWMLAMPARLGASGALVEPADKAEPAATGHGAPAGGGHSADASHAAEEPGLFPKSYDLGIWTLVVFILLFFILQRKAWPFILQNLQKREQGIAKAIAEAEQAREDAARLRVELQKELDRSGERVREILEAARRDAQHTKDEILAEARTEAQAEWERKRREIDTAFSQALQDIVKQSMELAALISTKAIRRQLSVDDHRRLVDESLAELKTAGKQRVGA
jgi:F-type H+-transporting ATPase subunit b